MMGPGGLPAQAGNMNLGGHNHHNNSNSHLESPGRKSSDSPLPRNGAQAHHEDFTHSSNSNHSSPLGVSDREREREFLNSNSEPERRRSSSTASSEGHRGKVEISNGKEEDLVMN